MHTPLVVGLHKDQGGDKPGPFSPLASLVGQHFESGEPTHADRYLQPRIHRVYINPAHITIAMRYKRYNFEFFVDDLEAEWNYVNPY
jgi:hypothetical protein